MISYRIDYDPNGADHDDTYCAWCGDCLHHGDTAYRRTSLAIPIGCSAEHAILAGERRHFQIHNDIAYRQHSTTTPNARFWIVGAFGSTVKLTLKPGQSLSHYVEYAHEEGWASEHSEYKYDGQTVTHRWETDGRDCDGRLTKSAASACDVGHLLDGNAFNGVQFPNWHAVQNVEIYDETAQLGGY